jgi:hypothetical protein
MVQGAFIGAADVHAGLFPDRFKPYQLADFRGVVDTIAAAGIEFNKVIAAILRGRFFGVCHKRKSILEIPVFSQQVMRLFSGIFRVIFKLELE